MAILGSRPEWKKHHHEVYDPHKDRANPSVLTIVYLCVESWVLLTGLGSHHFKPRLVGNSIQIGFTLYPVVRIPGELHADIFFVTGKMEK